MKSRHVEDIFMPLVVATLNNITRVGTVEALSGPVERGDASTVAHHLAALRSSRPELVPLFRHLSSGALNMAGRKGNLAQDAANALKSLLDQTTGVERKARKRR